jgi:hypothetical protein
MITSLRIALGENPRVRPQITLGGLGEANQFGSLAVQLSALGDETEPSYHLELGEGVRLDLKSKQLSLEPFAGRPLGPARWRQDGSNNHIEQQGGTINLALGGSAQVSLVRDADRLVIDPDGANNEIRLRQRPGQVEIDPSPDLMDQMTLQQAPDRLFLDRYGLNDTEIRRQGDVITIDGPKLADEITITRQGERISVDYPGWGNSLEVQRTSDGYIIDPAGWNNDIEVRRVEHGLDVDSFGWGEDVELRTSPRWATLNASGFSNDIDIRLES